MDNIIAYLVAKYKPTGMIVYGSFANGTNNLNSDFDALLIFDGTQELHDHSIICGTELDVFLYPKSTFEKEYSIQDLIQIWDGKILVDDTGLVSALKEKARQQIDSYAGKGKAENARNLAWCEKMLNRTKRGDMEGLYRLYLLLVDSLEIYFDLKGKYFFGPKKAIEQMSQMDPSSADLYFSALKAPTEENVSNWLERLKSI